MKRSEINSIIKRMETVIEKHQIFLPPYLRWTPEEWRNAGHEYNEIRDCMLGWDVTDYGMGKYAELGIALITIRNGNLKLPQYSKPYAEKLIMIEEGQVSPMHFHWKKMEDIINRGGGNLIFKLHNADNENNLINSDVLIIKDGRRFYVKAGTDIIIMPGESLTLYPYLYHEFIVQPGSGTTLVGEVSMVNDDKTDNHFLEPLGRFPSIEEDEVPYHLMCTEYPAAL